MKRFRLTMRQRENVYGYIFILPFVIGFLLFVLAPVIQSVVLSINEVTITQTGFDTTYIGFENYYFALRVHADFLRQLVEVMGIMLLNVFWILVFSFFAALLLNQEFRGRLVFRVIFFLPVVLASGVILQLEIQDYMMGVIGGEVQETYSFIDFQALSNFLTYLQVPEKFMEYIALAVDGISSIINASGIQILIFLAGLQSISPSLYEASEVEGATAWENFWLITLPMVSPLILTNIIYTIIDFFTSTSNSLIQLIRNTTFQGAGFGVSAAMSWIYFGAICVILGIVYLIFNRLVFYHD
ncbi:MAG TPA: sugar ABC transporter permease [Firmicutes bacterium]|jgi:ABC-type sugar transport system permease subunit|nr:sugar ABC transporter permease [Bacillota bacterium]